MTGQAVKVPSMVRMESPDVYASAFIWEGEGGPLVVAHGNDYTTGHKLENGEEVWRVQGLNPTNNGAWRFVSNPLLYSGPDRRPVVQERPDRGVQPGRGEGRHHPGEQGRVWRCRFKTDDAGRGRTHPRRRYASTSPPTARSPRWMRRPASNSTVKN